MLKGEIPLDRKTLKQYLPLKKEQERLEKKIDSLYDRVGAVPIVSGKVKSSMKEHPYIETHVTVQMPDPEQSARLDRLIWINEARKQQVDDILIAIEEFIQGIPDSTARQIFEMVFLEGKRQQEVADTLGYSRGRIPQIISKYLNN